MIKLTDVYKEIFDRLKTLPYKVYDETPANPSNPHIRVDYSYNRDKSGNNYEGITYFQYIHAFSTYDGRKEVLEMTDAICEVLAEDIVTADFVAFPYLERTDIINESANTGGQKTGYNINETYRHAVIVFKYIIYEN